MTSVDFDYYLSAISSIFFGPPATVCLAGVGRYLRPGYLLSKGRLPQFVWQV